MYCTITQHNNQHPGLTDLSVFCQPYYMPFCLQALQQWQELQQHWCSRMPLISQQQLEAAESAAWLLQRLASQQAQQQLLLEEDMEQLQQQTEVT